MEHQWYVLQVFSNYEHKIQRTLTDRIEITGLQSEITDVVVPIEEVVELKGGEKKTTERKFLRRNFMMSCVVGFIGPIIYYRH